MTKKCLLCNKVKGKRGCRLHDMKTICPQCCAGIRNTDCRPCSFYVAAENYQAERYQKSGDRGFIVELDETIEKQVDAALKEIEKKRFAGAEKNLTNMLRSHPDNHYIHFGMGTLYAFKGDNNKAIGHFQKAIEIFPYFVEAHYNLGVAYKKEINIAGMVRSFRNVLKIGAPNDTCCKEARRLLADTEQMVRKVNRTDLDTFIKAQDIFEKGMRLMKTGAWGQAIDAYKECLSLNAGTPQPHGNMGICYAKLGKREAAIDAFDKALVIDPKYELAILNKMYVERLAPGEVLEAPARIVEYYKDYPGKNRSYIEEATREMLAQPGDPGKAKE
jgi:tetratricopeptide (TPR) repeat protein